MKTLTVFLILNALIIILIAYYKNASEDMMLMRHAQMSRIVRTENLYAIMDIA